MKFSLKYWFDYSFLLAAILIIPACNWFGQKPVSNNLRSGLILVNVNDDVSFKDAHISNSINLPYEKIELEPNFLEKETNSWNKNSFIVVYCIDYACSASHIVAKKLKNLGFNNVHVYSGGIQEWYQFAQKDKGAFPYIGEGRAGYLKKEINKIDNAEGISVISAEELSNRLKDIK